MQKLKEKVIYLLNIYYENTRIYFVIQLEDRLYSKEGKIDHLSNDFVLCKVKGDFKVYCEEHFSGWAEKIAGLLLREIELATKDSDLISEDFWEKLISLENEQEIQHLMKQYHIKERSYHLWYFEGELLNGEDFEEISQAIWQDHLIYQYHPKLNQTILIIEPSGDLSIEDGASLVLETLSSQLSGKCRLFVSQRQTSYQNISQLIKYLPNLAQLYYLFYPNKYLGFEEGFEMGFLFKHLSKDDEVQFIKKVLGKEEELLMDVESMATLHHFFRHNLSIADTARSLFIHRNTLSYRLDKLSERLGRDIRRFEEASLVYMALMLQQNRI